MDKTKREFISEKNIKNIIYVIIFCAIPVLLLVTTMLIMNSVYGVLNINSFWGEVLTVQSLPTMISLGIVPWIMFKKMTNKNIKRIIYLKQNIKISRAISVVLLIGFLIALIYFGEKVKLIGPFVIHFLVIAIVEEILARGIISDLLNGIFEKDWIVILISALIFSFVFHSGNGFVTGLIYHVPFAVLMSFLYKRLGSLEVPIIIHWIYDVALTIFEVM